MKNFVIRDADFTFSSPILSWILIYYYQIVNIFHQVGCVYVIGVDWREVTL